jgi:flagellar basal body rod protein FlgG
MAQPVRAFDRVLDKHVATNRERDATDLTQGAVRATDRPLDFALMGDGFFVVRDGQNEYLTRNGAFESATDGTVLTAAGHAVMGENGEPLSIPAGVALEDVHVGEDGMLRDKEGNEIGRFLIERVPDEQNLARVGTTLFKTPLSQRVPAESVRVLGRTLESSNTVVFQELSSMMLLNRTVEALQRAQSSEVQAQRKMMEALSA